MTYKTLATEAEGEFKDRGSKFIALGFPVSNEIEAKEQLDEVKKKYHDARHHCYAWRLGTENIVERANDDGEPGNSAGKPILNQLVKFEVTNVILIVVRYFGGTLLGVGGLINAYRSATENALTNAKIIEVVRKATYAVHFEYEHMNSVMKVVKDFNLEVQSRDFDNRCEMKIDMELHHESQVRERFNSLTGVYLEKVEDDDL